MSRLAGYARRAALSVVTTAVCTVLLPATAMAQETRQEMMQGSAFDGDYLIVGVGAGVSPSYDGSDDYSAFGAPFVMGSLGGVDISPRGAGLALDFVPDADDGVYFDAGVSFALNSNRASGIKDEVVKSLGKLDRAIEVGPTVGIGYSGVLHGYDSISFSVDTLWDVAGAHKGMVVNPSVTYFTPVSRSAVAALSLNAEYGSGKYQDYYYAISPAQSLASGLGVHDPNGAGFTKAGVTLLGGKDLDGDLTNGGFVLAVIGNYSRMLGDAKRSPIVVDRGSANQFFGALGVAYIF